MHKELQIALQEAIGDLGTDVLKSPFLVNILQDYGAFDVHDKDAGVIKQRLSEMVKNGKIEKMLSWRNLSEKDLQNKGLALLKQYNDDKYTRDIINGVLKALALPLLQEQIIQPSEESIQNKTTKPIIPKNVVSYDFSQYKKKEQSQGCLMGILGIPLFIIGGLVFDYGGGFLIAIGLILIICSLATIFG